MAIDARRQPAIARQFRTLFGGGTASGLTDGELLGRFAARRGESSELAFAALLERHGGMVWGICRRVLDDPRDVEDAFQATFLILVRRARTIRNRDSLASWLHGVAYRVACSARSDGLRRRRHERLYAEGAERLAPPPRDEGLDLRPIVDGELLRLPEAYRAVVVLCDMEGLSYEQAARSLGWPMGTVKSRLARGREKLRSRLIRRGIAPLVGLMGAEVPAGLLESMAQAASRPDVGGVLSTQVIQLTEGVIRTMLLSKLKLSVAALAIGGGLVSLTGLLAGPGLGARAGVQEPRPAQLSSARPEEPTAEPVLESEPPLPASAPPPGRVIPPPWGTLVRIRVLSQGSVGLGSGTIIQSTFAESLVLTCAHIFKLGGPQPVTPDKFPLKVLVDLFDGKLRGDRPAQVTFDMTTGGEVVDFDFSRDVGLVRIRPGKKFTASPVVPTHWEARTRMKMLTVGCSEGQDATAWHTTVINAGMRGLPGNPSYEAIACTTAPTQGRAGGGLFTTDGYLAGVCNFAALESDQGLYANPRSIYSLLDRNGLSHLYAEKHDAIDFASLVPADEKPEANAYSPSGADDLKARLEESTRDNARLRDEVQRLRDELRSLRAGGQAATTSPAGQNAAPGVPARSSSPSAASPAVPGNVPRDSNASHTPQANQADPGEPGQEAEAQSHRRFGGLIFAASPTGNRVIAYDPVTRWTAALELNATRENPLKVAFSTNDFRQGPIALRIAGNGIRRVAAFDLKSRTWHAHDLAEPVSGKANPYPSGDGSIAYDLGRHLYTFNPKSLAWDHLDVSAIPDVAGEATKDGARAN
jgi:RNA polymerase sigma factor (sigma-70 family)